MKYIFKMFSELGIRVLCISVKSMMNQGRVVFVSLRWGRFVNFDTELQYNNKKIILYAKEVDCLIKF